MNTGFAKANNQGIKFALKEGADYVFLLNNDTKVIHSDWLARMVEIAEASRMYFQFIFGIQKYKI